MLIILKSRDIKTDSVTSVNYQRQLNKYQLKPQFVREVNCLQNTGGFSSVLDKRATDAHGPKY